MENSNQMIVIITLTALKVLKVVDGTKWLFFTTEYQSTNIMCDALFHETKCTLVR